MPGPDTLDRVFPEHLPNPAGYLRKRYILALSLIVILLGASQAFIQLTIARDIDDSRVVNIAGRQRMLSQKMSKTALELVLLGTRKPGQGRAEEAEARRLALANDLKSSADLWQRSHDGLLHGDPTLGLKGNNSGTVLGLFNKIEGPYATMLKSARNLAALAEKGWGSEGELLELSVPLLVNEGSFLAGMNEITFQYDAESAKRVRSIRFLELVLFLVTLLTIAIEALFIFMPADRQIDSYFHEIRHAMTLLEERALRDGMTGLFNKRTGILILEREMAKAERQKTPLSLCFLDLDGLKALNDSAGHEAGDRLIKDFASAVAASVRDEDTAFRYGGDEFVLILACPAEVARQVVERLRQGARTGASASGGGPISFSCGIAVFAAGEFRDPEAFIGRADAAMYEDKKRRKQGR